MCRSQRISESKLTSMFSVLHRHLHLVHKTSFRQVASRLITWSLLWLHLASVSYAVKIFGCTHGDCQVGSFTSNASCQYITLFYVWIEAESCLSQQAEYEVSLSFSHAIKNVIMQDTINATCELYDCSVAITQKRNLYLDQMPRENVCEENN